MIGREKMDKGYIENGFIVDLSNARKTSEIIYELSRILDIPEAKNKQVCLKMGSVALSVPELTSIKALVESMDSEIEFINTLSPETAESAKVLGVEVSELENVVEAPDFEMEPEWLPLERVKSVPPAVSSRRKMKTKTQLINFFFFMETSHLIRMTILQKL